jgi:hypothetical protein
MGAATAIGVSAVLAVWMPSASQELRYRGSRMGRRAGSERAEDILAARRSRRQVGAARLVCVGHNRYPTRLAVLHQLSEPD